MKLKTRDMILVALFAALSAIGAFIKIPTPTVPITLQVFFVALSGVLLGSRLGALSQFVYVLIGLVGVPVFTNGGGPSYIFQPSFGYLISYIFAAFIIGKIVEQFKEINLMKIIMAISSGLFVIYLIGVPYLYMILNFYLGKSIAIGTVLQTGMLIFLPGDIIKIIVAAILSVNILPILKRAGLAKVAATE
ncbi:MAG: biotin transporter BioY [Clostridiaceae bacterium]